MHCTEARELLQPFLDGELKVETTARVLGHLERCRACRAQADEEQALRAAIVRACHRPLASSEGRALVDAVCAREAPSGAAGHRAWGIAVAAVVAALAVAALVLAGIV